MTRREYEVTDPAQIKEILDNAKYLHLGLVDEGMPYVLPMNYGYTFEDGKMTLYLHSAKKGYKMDVIRKNPVCCFSMESNVAPFYADVACRNGMSYSCLMGRGKITILEDPADKIAALSNLTTNQTGKVHAFTEKMVSIVSVMKVDVDVYSAKRRKAPEEYQ